MINDFDPEPDFSLAPYAITAALSAALAMTVLKLHGDLPWTSWWVVLSPVWAPLALCGCFILVMLVMSILTYTFDQLRGPLR